MPSVNMTCRKKNKLMCYPQQLGSFWKVFVPERSGTLFAMCTGHSAGHLSNSGCYLHRNHPELHRPSEPQPSGTFRNLISHLHWNPPEPHQQSAPKPSGTSSAPEPSGTLRAICTGTVRNLISHLHPNPPDPHQLSPPEPSGTSSAICTGTLRNLLRNLVLQLHRIAPELFWAKDPIASFAVGEKKEERFTQSIIGHEARQQDRKTHLLLTMKQFAANFVSIAALLEEHAHDGNHGQTAVGKL